MRYKFHERLRDLRVEKGLSQYELGRILGFGNSSICRYESQTQIPSLKALIVFALFFDVPIDYLVGLED